MTISYIFGFLVAERLQIKIYHDEAFQEFQFPTLENTKKKLNDCNA